MRPFKNVVIVGVISLALLAALEFGARWLEPPRPVDQVAAMTNALVSRRQPPDAPPSWAKPGECPAATPARANLFEPNRPAALGEGLSQVAVGSYYSPQWLMENAWSANAFQPDNASGAVAVFGASTIAGDGLPCLAYTIPSQVQRLLREGVPASLLGRLGASPRVDNLGQSAFVSYNQFLLLVNLLRYGYRPRLVVFYQGHNDALQRVLTASPHFNYGSYAIGASGLYSLRYSLRDSLLSRSALLRLLSDQPSRMNNLIVEGRGHAAAVFTGTLNDLMSDRAMAERAKATAVEMHSQAAVISALAQAYDFDLVVVSYPSVFSKRVPAPSEAETIGFARANTPAFEKAIVLTQNAMNDAFAPALPRVYYRDIRDCFGGSGEAVFKDISHVTARGNELLARCVFDAIADIRPQ